MEFLRPSAGFDDPLALLSACHQRIEVFCDTLERLVSHLQRVGPDGEARQAAGRIMAYFDQAATNHQADEEVDLLPLLQLHGDAESVSTLAEWAEHISREHLELDAAWIVLRGELKQIISGNGTSLEAANKFIEMERKHYQFEDQEVFPLARKLLQEKDLETLGRAMARRRNRPYPKDA